MKDNDFKKEQFILQIKMPFMWYLTAETLFNSYKILTTHAEVHHREFIIKKGLVNPTFNTLSTALLLAGFAFENLLKGKMLQDDENCLNSSGKFKHTSHQLNELAERANIEVNDSEQELLQMLTAYTCSAGRYPVPLKSDDMFPTVDLEDDGFKSLLSHYFNADGTCQTFSKINDLFVKIKSAAGCNILLALDVESE